MRAWTLLLAALLLAGCTDNDGPNDDRDGDGYSNGLEETLGSDPDNATILPPPTTYAEDKSFSDTVQTVGTGVPTVQCPADMINSQTLTWTIEGPGGNATDVHLTDMTFAIQGALTVNDVDLFITTPTGSASATGSTADEQITLGGKQMVGDYQIEIRGCSGVGDVTVEASGVLRWAIQVEPDIAKA